MISPPKSIWLKSFSKSWFGFNSIPFLNLSFHLLNRKMESLYKWRAQTFTVIRSRSSPHRPELVSCIFLIIKSSPYGQLYVCKELFQKESNLWAFTLVLRITQPAMFISLLSRRLCLSLGCKSQTAHLKNKLWGSAMWMYLETPALFLTTCEHIQETSRCKSPICSLRCLLTGLFS